MPNSIRDAFLRGKARSDSRSKTEAELVAEAIQMNATLWNLMREHSDLVRQAGYEIGKLDPGGFKIQRLRPPLGYAPISWDVTLRKFSFVAVDSEDKVMIAYGSTPLEAAETLMFYIAQEAVRLNTD